MKLWWLVIILVVSLVFRLGISGLGVHDDLYSNTAWSEWIYLHGANGFYDNQVWVYSWPTQPPLVSLLYGANYWLYARLGGRVEDLAQLINQPWSVDFWYWFQDSYYGETPLKAGAIVTIKLWPILADLGIAMLIYWIALRVAKQRRAWVWSLIYLVSPFSWYLSAWWGQYDGVGFLLLALAGVAMVYRRLVWAAVLVFLSLGIKPTGLILVPFLAWVYFRQRPKWWQAVLSVGIVGGLFWITTMVFTTKPVPEFVVNELIPKIFYKTDFRLTTNAFNFWRIWTSGIAQSQEWLFLGIAAKWWGIVIFGLLNLLVWRLVKEINVKTFFQGVFIIGGGGWLFMTNMLDRYFLAALISLLIWSIFERRYFKIWLVMSLVFWCNLYNQWWFPSQLDNLKQAMLWQGGLLTQVLSAINVICFGWVVFDASKRELGLKLRLPIK